MNTLMNIIVLGNKNFLYSHLTSSILELYRLFGLLSPIEPRLDIENMNQGSARTSQYYAAFLRD